MMLTAKELTRRFGGVVAVNNLSFSVNQGEIFGFIGPNGAGKTTLFNLITGLIPPSSGELIYQGRVISQLPPHQIAGLGIARTFQNIRLFGELSVLDNVIIARHLHTHSNIITGVLGLPLAVKEEENSREKALELLTLIGLDNRTEEKAKNLAYGDQRRLEIARALALEPQILLLDEPAAGMNLNEKQQLSEFIRDLRDRFHFTIIIIEHHVPLVMGLCDRIAVLDFGQLIALDKPSLIRNNPKVIAAYLGNE
ncbi:ABC transporter ATP-binding protein [Dolichospermum circinale CS-1225]|uniref:ABC transporter ATP-binding protein n=1 Tax=Dolichospermum circinale TaxID=109265 RepID=UPI00054FA5C3|nr:ABC transporter ATP-binding protein [Dolichospermum circinale]MDB9457090.1 ABC transporter ATP-binding protein [Dolichospermum circinale CS-545/17]MDB9482456.1 ABC transporter ATP-binding protein [Dolichospermum circinale CS-537/05]MDB9468890.1 ABC transporter ATP-binding protein [Dolichospermum circinale CS-539/09]MDB9469954.1 ABC transporter ATP-binding protein [Dolichospermum circinale CS-539]MDB9474673.1 ABC transporter ATP-binding protein [Dolichospermum circinale CS-537/11]